MNTVSNYDQKRAKLIKMIHIAANELGLLDPKRHETDSEDEYHLLLRQWNRPGTRQAVTSSTQMSTEQLEELYRHLKRSGFKVKRQKTEDKLSHEERQRPVSRGGAKGAEKAKDESWKKYPSSLDGMKQEICDLAWVRWGGIKPGPGIPPDGTWELPLNNFCQRFGVRHWKWLDVSHGKEIKAALLRLQNAVSRGGAEVAEEEEPIPF